MAVEKVTTIFAKGTPKERTLSVDYDFGGSIERAVELFGADVVYARFHGSAVTDAQNQLRALGRKDASDKEIRATLANWRPRLRASRRTNDERVLADFLRLSEEEKAKVLASMETAIAA